MERPIFSLCSFKIDLYCNKIVVYLFRCLMMSTIRNILCTRKLFFIKFTSITKIIDLFLCLNFISIEITIVTQILKCFWYYCNCEYRQLPPRNNIQYVCHNTIHSPLWLKKVNIVNKLALPHLCDVFMAVRRRTRN